MEKLNKKIFSTLFFSIFTTVTGAGIVVPLLPVYAHDLGASGLYIGLMFGAFSISRTLFLPYFGRLSDKKGRKPLIVAGLFAYALISVAFIFSNNVETIIAIRFIHGITSAMIMPVVQAYVGDITPEGSEGLSMGMFNMSMFFGLSIGPLIGGVINDRFSLEASFLSMGFLAFVGFFLSLFLLPPTRSERVVRKGEPPTAWRQILSDRTIAGLFLFRITFTVCIGIIWGFLPILADSEFGLSSSSIGILIMLGVFVSGLIHTPMGFLADRVNKQIMVIIGGVITAYAVFSYQLAGDFRDLLIASIIFGLGGGISMPALMAIAVLKGKQIGAMGSIMAFLTMGHSLGMLVGSFLAGLMMDIFQLRQAFSLGAIIMVIGAGLFVFLCRQSMDKYGVKNGSSI